MNEEKRNMLDMNRENIEEEPTCEVGRGRSWGKSGNSCYAVKLFRLKAVQSIRSKKAAPAVFAICFISSMQCLCRTSRLGVESVRAVRGRLVQAPLVFAASLHHSGPVFPLFRDFSEDIAHDERTGHQAVLLTVDDADLASAH